jgi:hypothetical protein
MRCISTLTTTSSGSLPAALQQLLLQLLRRAHHLLQLWRGHTLHRLNGAARINVH